MMDHDEGFFLGACNAGDNGGDLIVEALGIVVVTAGRGGSIVVIVVVAEEEGGSCFFCFFCALYLLKCANRLASVFSNRLSSSALRLST